MVTGKRPSNMGRLYAIEIGVNAIVYRALLESILDRAQSKAYPHAARYLHRLGKLAKKIRAWSPIAPHESYLQALRARHDRKRAFWAQVSAG